MPGATIETREIRKLYPGTVALDGLSIRFLPGQVHALLGKNGAGKSTLVRILSGATEPTSGQIVLDGRETRLRSPRDALQQGIATVHQELSLIPDLTVAENILLGRWPRGVGLRRLVLNWREIERTASGTLASLNVRLDVRRRAGQLSVGQQQIVEIARAISGNASVLMLDEPTAALASHEVNQLFGLIRGLAGRGVTVIYITHRLQELCEIADCVSVLRDGRLAGSLPIAETSPKAIVQLMFGRSLPQPRIVETREPAAPALDVRHLRVADKLDDVSFSLGRGEILGLAGMLGAGRTELLMTLFGATPPTRGEIRIDGRPLHAKSPRSAKAAGLALAPEDRQRQGLVLEMSVRNNLCLASLDRLSRLGLIWKGLQRPVVDRNVRDLKIVLADSERPVALLSGGNQQKVVLGNWLNTQPRLFLFDEPTRGIDLQAKQQIFEIIRDLSRRGIGSMFVSSELEELLEVCHRILVLRGGRIAAQVRPEETTLDNLLTLCMEATVP